MAFILLPLFFFPHAVLFSSLLSHWEFRTGIQKRCICVVQRFDKKTPKRYEPSWEKSRFLEVHGHPKSRVGTTEERKAQFPKRVCKDKKKHLFFMWNKLWVILQRRSNQVASPCYYNIPGSSPAKKFHCVSYLILPQLISCLPFYCDGNNVPKNIV